MPAIFLNEEEVGSSDVIAYPHLLLCCGVTLVLNNGMLAGGHITTPANSAQDVCQRALVLAGAHTIERVYFTGNLRVHDRAARDYTVHLNNYQGDVYLYNTRDLNYMDGTFIVVTHGGAGHAPTIQYKRNVKVEYATRLVPKVGGLNAFGGTLPVMTEGAKRTGVEGPLQPGDIYIPKLHTAGFKIKKVKYPYPNH